MRLPSDAANVMARARRITRRNFHSRVMCLRKLVVGTPDTEIVGLTSRSGYHPIEVARSLKGGKHGADWLFYAVSASIEAGLVQRPAAPGELLSVPVAELGERDALARGVDEPAVADVDRGVEDLSSRGLGPLR